MSARSGAQAPPDVVDEILALYAAQGDATYTGEALSQSEHAIQAALLAEGEGAPSALVVAALLHDIGHLLQLRAGARGQHVRDLRHEAAGANWLARHFGPEVSGAVRLHVAAKRYLCAREPRYGEGLSAASQHSLALQGGPFDADAAAAFEREAGWREAVRLRRWDDAAKRVGLAVPPLASFRPRIEAVLQS